MNDDLLTILGIGIVGYFILKNLEDAVPKAIVNTSNALGNAVGLTQTQMDTSRTLFTGDPLLGLIPGSQIIPWLLPQSPPSMVNSNNTWNGVGGTW
jgi:hypothetical protein